jgi:formylglycine-generating enzyme required for sulfatase activity
VQICGADRAFGPCACDGFDAAPPTDLPQGADLGTAFDVPMPPADQVSPDTVTADDVANADAAADDSPPVDRPPPPDVGFRCPPVMVDATGGTVRCEGVVLNVPAGALTSPVAIQIIPTAEPSPSGYTGFSSIYRIEPAATSFARPAQLTLPFTGDAARAAIFWSRPTGSTGYQRLGGIPAGGTITTQLSRLGAGFVADGVEFREVANRACTVTRLLEGRLVPPSGVAMFFTAEDCEGRPLTDLTAGDFDIRENDTPLSSEATVSLLNRAGPQVFVNLVLDLSASTAPFVRQLIAASRQFVTTLQQTRALPVQIGVQVFAGESMLTEWQAPTLDTARLLSRLDALAMYRAADPSSTNLYGALIDALSRQASAEAAFRVRNLGGAFTTGYVVLFTDGGDTAGLRTQMQATEAVRNSPARVIPVGLNGTDAMPAVLTALASRAGDVLTADDPSTLTREFDTLANRIAAQYRTAYLLGYCSPRRAGMHAVTVGVRGGTTMPIARYEFSAQGFGPGCSAATFRDACGMNDQCGGLGCGGCDDRVAYCSDRRCRSFCAGWTNPMPRDPPFSPNLQPRCGGVSIMNPRGYTQSCADSPDSTSCSGACRDLTIDFANCGTCGNRCAQGASCIAGVCTCPMGTTVCNGVCRDLQRDPQSCGTCGNVCAQGASCIAGVCTCPMGGGACNGVCRALSSDTANCGACGNVCAQGASCIAGVCTCPMGTTVCNGVCRALSSDTANCGRCGQSCGPTETCSAGRCAPLTCPSGTVLIPAGSFVMGAPVTEGNSNERPQRTVTLSAYCLGVSEVTVAEYQRCVTAGSCTAPNTGSNCNWNVSGRANHPINCIDWTQAGAVCAFLYPGRGRLPTEAEWENAASVGGTRRYPWGDTTPTNQLCWRDNNLSLNSTCAVGSFPSGNTPSGIQDLSGNVLEWVSDWYGNYPSNNDANPAGPTSGSERVFRGGNWSDRDPAWVRARSRDRRVPSFWDGGLGVRCASGAR